MQQRQSRQSVVSSAASDTPLFSPVEEMTESSSDAKKSDGSGGSSSIMKVIQDNMLLVLLSGGVLGSFTVFGYAQEALTRGTYGGERFTFPVFLIVVQSFGNCLVAAVILLVTGNKKWGSGAPTKDWLIVSGTYLGAHFCGLSALRYIPFPLQVVCKSCKAVPVMFGEIIFAKKHHPLEKKIQVVLMVLGVVAFTLSSGSKKGGSDWDLTPTLFLGLALVLGALVCDGIYGPYQNTIVSSYNASPYHLMFNMNFYEFFMALAIALWNGELQAGIAFTTKHPGVLSKLGYFSVTMAFGSLCVYTMQKNFGALTVTLTTTLRKLISVVFSVLWFGHSLQAMQWVATVVVFLASPISGWIVKGLGLKKGGKSEEEKRRAL